MSETRLPVDTFTITMDCPPVYVVIKSLCQVSGLVLENTSAGDLLKKCVRQ